MPDLLRDCQATIIPTLGHSELGAFFGPPSSANADDLALFEAMREYWTSFVTTGQPSGKNGIAWKVHTLIFLLPANYLLTKP